MTKPYTGVTQVRKFVALASALSLVLLLSALPANAQTYPQAVDRTAVTLTYWPSGGATSAFSGAVSYQFGPGPWDVLASYRSGPATGATQFTFGGRYHLRPPSSGSDVYGTLQYASPSPGTSYFMVGGGLTETLAPGLKSYFVLNYAFIPAGAVIVPNMGFQYQVSRQLAVVAGVDVLAGTGYLGVNFDFASR